MDYKEPEWTAENMNRKQGDTTFKTCGWCTYASCGSCRYDCHIETSCDLMKDWGEERECYWDTPCKIKQLGQEDIKSIIESKKYEIRNLKDQLKDKHIEIGVLKKIKVSKKPCLPDNRPADYFPLKSVVYVFHNNRWNRGIVVNGYRSGDGCVSYVLDDYPDSRKGWGCGFGVPCVIKGWEYDYFRKHSEEFKAWLKMCDRKYNGDKLPMDDYLKAMKADK